MLLLPESVLAATGSSRPGETVQGAQVLLVLSCEHGGNEVPDAFGYLFSAHRLLLETHRGYDLGALVMARELAAGFDAPLVTATTSRLLVDLNRSEHHPRLHLETVRAAPAAVRQRILKQHYYPYRNRLESLVLQGIEGAGRVLHVSVHSFTPELAGVVRNADVALLYDPARAGERTLCQVWKRSLGVAAPGLRVRRNYPYAGRGDGLTRYFRNRLPAEQYIGVELELNQALAAGPAPTARTLRAAVLRSLQLCLSGREPELASVANRPTDLPA